MTATLTVRLKWNVAMCGVKMGAIIFAYSSKCKTIDNRRSNNLRFSFRKSLWCGTLFPLFASPPSATSSTMRLLALAESFMVGTDVCHEFDHKPLSCLAITLLAAVSVPNRTARVNQSSPKLSTLAGLL